MRRTFGKTLADLAEKDEKILLLVGDIGYGIFDDFRKKISERFINLGIAEQSMVGIGAGLALQGYTPFIYTITPFLIERAFEQIKLDVDEMKLNVKLVGYADYPEQGPTHSELDAKGLMDLLPNTKGFYPRNGNETRYMTEEMYKKGPAFMSLKSDPNF